MFENGGEKIKAFGKVSFWILTICVIIIAVTLAVGIGIIYGLIFAVAGIFVAYFEALFAVALGDILITVQHNGQKIQDLSSAIAEKKSLPDNKVVLTVNSDKEYKGKNEASETKRQIIGIPEKWISQKSSAALKFVDTVLKFKFKTDEDRMGWVKRNFDKQTDDVKEKLCTLVPYMEKFDTDGFMDELIKLYKTLE